MLFNFLLIPIKLVMLWMILKIRSNLGELHFEPNGTQEYRDTLYDVDEDFIRNHNLKYILPPLNANLFIWILMSISTFVFERNLYHAVISIGFPMSMAINFVFMFLGRRNLEKRKR